MEEQMMKFINRQKEIKQLYLDKETLNNIIEDYKREILSNKENFIELYKIDQEATDEVFNLNDVIKLLNLYKDEEIIKKEKEIIISSFYGNPLITINLCMQAIIKNRGTILAIEDNMFAVNKMLVTLFNNILSDYKIANMIELYNNLRIEDEKEAANNIDYVICIGNTNTYFKLYKEDIKNLKYVPFKNTSLYSKDKEFKDLKYELYKYSIQKGIEIEIYEDLDEFIACTNIDEEIENVVVFSNDKEEIKMIKETIKNNNLYINENPFKDEDFKINID